MLTLKRLMVFSVFCICFGPASSYAQCNAELLSEMIKKGFSKEEISRLCDMERPRTSAEESRINELINKISELERKWIQWHDVYNTDVNQCHKNLPGYLSNSEHSRRSEQCVANAEARAMSYVGHSKSSIISEQGVNRLNLINYIENNPSLFNYTRSKLVGFSHNVGDVKVIRDKFDLWNR